MQIFEVSSTVLPVIIMLGIGVICRKNEIISREGVQSLKNVAVNIALPAFPLCSLPYDGIRSGNARICSVYHALRIRA